ncbi:MAG TPA: hypothetical protein VIT91_02980 [Chthoniobacterales bacterium]
MKSPPAIQPQILPNSDRVVGLDIHPDTHPDTFAAAIRQVGKSHRQNPSFLFIIAPPNRFLGFSKEALI